MSDIKLFDAIEFAARAHAGQYRKGTRIPYIVHPLAVARILIENDAPENVVVAALLHDVVEDTRVTLPEIRAAFGNEVAALVEGTSEPNRRDTWEHRKQHTLDWLANAPLNVVLIKVADQLDNIRSIRQDYLTQGDAVWKRFNRGRDQQKWYHEGLADVFQQRLTSPEGQMLAREFASHVYAVFGENPANGLESG